MSLAERIGDPEVACVAPAAADNSWWPGSFLAPLAENEPWLSSALGAVDALLHTLGDRSRVVLGGFSQGACLAAEYALRHPGPLRRAAALHGRVLRAARGRSRRGWTPSRGRPVYIGRPRTRTAGCRSGACARRRRRCPSWAPTVQLDVFEGMDHLVNDEEIAAGRALLSGCG